MKSDGMETDRNGGKTLSGSGKTQIKTDFPVDKSAYAGSASDERGRKLGGSVDNLSHSLKGTSANQRGK